jgi:hypothetical protein
MRLPGLAAACWRASAVTLLGAVLVLLAGVATRSVTLLLQFIPLCGLASLLRLCLARLRPRSLHCDLCGRQAAVEGRGDGIRQPPGWKIVERTHLDSDEVAFHEVYCECCTPWSRQRATRPTR